MRCGRTRSACPAVPGSASQSVEPDVDGVGVDDDLLPSRAEDSGPFFHGTKADLRAGDVLEPGYSSNYGEGRTANDVYLTATMDAAIWGAELVVGEGPGRIYRVEPTGPLRG